MFVDSFSMQAILLQSILGVAQGTKLKRVLGQFAASSRVLFEFVKCKYCSSVKFEV